MAYFLDSTDVDRFRDIIALRFGLHFDIDRKDQLEETLRQAVGRTSGSTPAVYLQLLEAGRLPQEEFAFLIREITVAETHFFRHPDQFRAMAELALPELVHGRPRRDRLTALSLGCASGEETYSLAFVLREKCAALPGVAPSVTGIDVNPAVVARAVQGRYTEWSLRGLPDELRRYFRQVGKESVLDDTIRAGVSFEERNLLAEDPAFWKANAFDIVFCRNVLMYFTPEAARIVVARIARSLVPGGFLFIGPAETLRGVSQDFHLRHSHDTFYYQRRGENEAPALKIAERAKSIRPALAGAPLLPDVDISWLDAIQRASERIASLCRQSEVVGSGSPPDRKPAAIPPEATAAGADLATARELLRQERFDEALLLLQGLPTGQESDPDAQLLRAIILTNRGDIDRAEALCRQVLAGDEMNAEAHYLLALCREHAGEFVSAVEEDETAIYLDQQFAMPYLHLGLMRLRAGDRAGARQAFHQARILLPREDASRILLLGGGFSRESLVRLSLAEWYACGGS